MLETQEFPRSLHSISIGVFCQFELGSTWHDQLSTGICCGFYIQIQVFLLFGIARTLGWNLNLLTKFVPTKV